MELAWLYTALALLVATLIFLLKNKKPEVDAGAAARPAPVQAGPGGRRQPRRLRQQVIFHVPKLLFCIMSQKICQGRSLNISFCFQRDGNNVEELPVDHDDDEAEQRPGAATAPRFDADGKKIGAKKARKLEEKENKRIQREIQAREREEEKQRKEELG